MNYYSATNEHASFPETKTFEISELDRLAIIQTQNGISQQNQVMGLIHVLSQSETGLCDLYKWICVGVETFKNTCLPLLCEISPIDWIITFGMMEMLPSQTIPIDEDSVIDERRRRMVIICNILRVLSQRLEQPHLLIEVYESFIERVSVKMAGDLKPFWELIPETIHAIIRSLPIFQKTGKEPTLLPNRSVPPWMVPMNPTRIPQPSTRDLTIIPPLSPNSVYDPQVTLHVSNLPKDLTEQELLTAFRNLGFNVTQVRKNTDWSFAFMVLSSPEETRKALKYHRSHFAGREIAVNPYNPASKSPIMKGGSASQVYVGNLKTCVTEDELRQHFKTGVIVTIIKNTSWKHAYITFSSEDEAIQAIKKYNGSWFCSHGFMMELIVQPNNTGFLNLANTTNSSQVPPLKKPCIDPLLPRLTPSDQISSDPYFYQPIRSCYLSPPDMPPPPPPPPPSHPPPPPPPYSPLPSSSPQKTPLLSDLFPLYHTNSPHT